MCGRYIVVLGLVLPIVSGLLTNCQLNEGGGCSAFCQCGPGLQCEAGVHVCRGPAKEGEACHLTRHCGPGLQCEAGVHVCRRAGKEGDACHITRHCGPGLQCEAGTHICRRPAKEGEACHVTRHCGPGLICKEYHHVCERMGEVGEKCMPSMLSGFGRACNYQKNNWCDPYSRKCLPPSGKGNICGFVGAKEDSAECAPGLSCSCNTACSVNNMLKDLEGALSGVAQTIQDLIGKKQFCCKCV